MIVDTLAAATDQQLKKRQIEVLSLAEGFLQSSVLFALLRLRIFELIDSGSRSLEELATEVQARPETLARLLNAGVALKLLVSSDGVAYRLSPACLAVLSPSSGEQYLGDWIRSLDYFCGPLQRLDDAVLHSAPTADPSVHLGGDRESTRSFALSMHNYATLRGRELADFLDTSGCASILDLGCGPGTYAFHLGMRNSGLELSLADHAVVLETAREVQERFPLKNRVRYLPLDALRDEIPGTYDLVLVSNMLHGLGEETSRALLKRLYRSVNPGGSLVVQAQYLRDDRLGNRWPVFLDLIQLCVTDKGRNHAPKETRQWLEDAGFRNVEYCAMTLMNTNSYLRGYKI
ncbi:MAG: methyltransferase [Nitrospiraceae bacterium]|nr:methyltransferase [Nitrospiraceae bacterium]